MNNRIFNLIESGTRAFGTWISLGTPAVTELASRCGFDWLLLDLEHGCFTEAEILPNLQAMGNSAAAAIVRVPSLEPPLIARMLDRGTDGIMAPHISSAAEAISLVAATRYAPAGKRGFSRTVRAYGYGLHLPAGGSQPRPVVMAQIESLPGVTNAAEIAGVAGIDVLFVGPADLSQDLAARDMGDRFDECLQTVAEAARGSGKSAGILVRDLGDLPKLAALGYSVFAVHSDLGLLRGAYQQAVGFFRGACGPDAGAPKF